MSFLQGSSSREGVCEVMLAARDEGKNHDLESDKRSVSPTV